MSALSPAPGKQQAATLRRLSRWLLLGEWRAHPLRALMAIAAIAVGVALGFAIHLINGAAFNEFSTAISSLSGQADLQVGATEAYFDEEIYPRLAEKPEVAVASPVLQLDAVVPGQKQPLRIIGMDSFRAVFITPDLLGMPASGEPADSMAADAVFLSGAAESWLGAKAGSMVHFQSGTHQVALRFAGALQRARVGQRLGVMDLGAAQWRFNKLGQLSRIDLKLRDGVDRQAFQAQLAQELQAAYPGRFRVSQPNDENQNSRNSNLSRAYRVNLSVLALVALFTGAFLVFSTQALSVTRRRSQFALLRVLGLERRRLLRQVLLEGLSLGILGAALGIGAGYAFAAAALRFFGGDLGAGYFSGVQPAAQFDTAAAIVYFLLGVGVALLGCAGPAWEAARAMPAVALKSGSDEMALRRLAKAWPGLACLAVAALMALAPPVLELPLFGYLSIALLLIGGIALMPRLAALTFRFAHRRWQAAMAGRRAPPAVPTLTLARLANASGQAGVALGGVLSSFSLMVAMAIMVASFRVSVDDWLLQILPADLYANAGAGSTAGLSPQNQQAIRTLPGVARADFMRLRSVSLAPDRANIMIMARNIDEAHLDKAMVLTSEVLTQPAGRKLPPVWVSEAMADLYGAKPGGVLTLPLQGRPHEFFIGGIWRDYARSTGAVTIQLSDYRAITGDMEVSGSAIWLEKGASAAVVQQRLKALEFGGALEVTSPGELRALSLKIFDRSFAVTYLLEAIAIVIGLFGVAATFSAQTLARAREFGMLRHVGLTRRQILGILALEGGTLTALGIATGFVLGLAISVILVYVINPQSFHWSMQMHFPWTLLASVAGALLVAAALTALFAGRQALSGSPLRAVREDW
ncbi:FtsX-like permease family protein [Massilia sp. erpn]|uniref:ABC transporter permease n=1 Tax=Massilia sp. erpn TaxID=2738142 RepID=UPI0021063572|nr:FtsX-like permease family protein [Massilia sp. erpn]UTY59765.1 ABC transporter permease [Massilia sp. erpn]